MEGTAYTLQWAGLLLVPHHQSLDHPRDRVITGHLRRPSTEQIFDQIDGSIAKCVACMSHCHLGGIINR